MAVEGKWSLSEIEYLPTELGADDGGFADAGVGHRSAAEEVGLGGGTLVLSKDGRYALDGWSTSIGTWHRTPDGVKLECGEETIVCNVDGDSLCCVEFDEEHGRRIRVHFERPASVSDLPKNVRRALQQFYDPIEEYGQCPHSMFSPFVKLWDANTAHRRKLILWIEGKHLFSLCLFDKNWKAVNWMMAHGYRSPSDEKEQLIHALRYVKGKKAEAVSSWLRERGTI